MADSKLERLLAFIQKRRLMDEARLARSIRQFKAIDRRFGQVGVFLGYLKPEQVNEILVEQARRGGRFSECAVRLGLLTPEQSSRVLILQHDDLSIFAQAVGVQRAATPVEFTSCLTEFLRENPDAAVRQDEPAGGTLSEVEESVISVLRHIEHVSPLPGTVERVVALLDDPNVDLDEVARNLKLDPGLTATLLRVANSAFFGLRSKIGSVKKALQILGTDKLRQLIVTAGIMQKFQGVPPEFARAFWQRSMRAAEFSKEMGKYCGIAELDELFVCGFLHNIGEMVVKQFFSDHWTRIHGETPVPGGNVLRAEREHLGATHADVGGFLFHIWKLPPAVIQSAMFHHQDFTLLLHTPHIVDEAFIVHMASTIGGLDTDLDAFRYSKALDIVGDQYRHRLKYPEKLDINQIMQRVETTLTQLSQNSLN